MNQVPNQFDFLQKALLHFNAGRMNRADDFCKKALKRSPGHPDALNLAGVIALRRAEYDRATELLREAQRARPQDPRICYNMGLAFAGSLDFAAAADAYRAAIRLSPGFGPAYADLCYVLTELGDPDAAIEAGTKAIAANPNDGRAHNNLAVAYDAWGDFDSSLKHYKRASMLSPEHPQIQVHLGHAYIAAGDKAAAERCYRAAIRLNPSYGEPHRHLVSLRRYTNLVHEDVVAISGQLQDKSLGEPDRIELLFAFAKIHADCQQYDEAFDLYKRANALVDRRYRKSVAKYRDAVVRTGEFFSREFFEIRRDFGVSDASPIFVVGVPRSGTTLVEQIIASHPGAHGAGELQWFSRLEHRLPELMEAAQGYPECLLEMGRDEVAMFAKSYIEYTRALAGGDRRVVDKMPENFMRIGLIKLLFPHAKVVACARDPRDTAVSIFSEHFAGSIHWGYDLYKIGAYINCYLEMMAHWKAVFDGQILEVGYEELVDNQEAVSQRIIEFVGLEWDPACLDFYAQKRPVRTASSLQVTKPMYRHSIGRWKRYGSHLKPLMDGLGDLGWMQSAK